MHAFQLNHDSLPESSCAINLSRLAAEIHSTRLKLGMSYYPNLIVIVT